MSAEINEVLLDCKLKLMKVLSDLSLDNASFLVIAHMKQQNFCSKCLGNREGQKSTGLSLACQFPVAC